MGAKNILHPKKKKNYPMEVPNYSVIFLLWHCSLSKDLSKIPRNISLLTKGASEQRSFQLTHLTRTENCT